MKGIKGTCSHCKKKNIEVKKVFNYMLCQRCWASCDEKVRNQFPVFKLNFIQKVVLKLADRMNQMGRAKKRVMTTKQREASNRR
jgi:hypothetical protein